MEQWDAPFSRRRLEEALDDLIVNERGVDFQRIAVPLARTMLPQIVSSEIHWDGGEDGFVAHGTLEGERVLSIAASITATWPHLQKTRIKAFFNDYLEAETGPVPFGGRDPELAALDGWLQDDRAPPRMMIVAPSGSGKSALLVRWIVRLRTQGALATGAESIGSVTSQHTSSVRNARWHLVFVPVSMGAPMDTVSADRALVSRLATLTAGDPLVLTHYAMDLWKQGKDVASLTRESLDGMKPGFGAYFDRWLELQESAWRRAGENVNSRDADAVLLILAFAKGPLEGTDLVELVSSIPGTTPTCCKPFLR